MLDKPRREFVIPETVQQKAQQLGIRSIQSVQEMLRHSARITHPLGNRRYNDYLFMVEGEVVKWMGRVTDVAPPVAPPVVAPPAAPVAALLRPKCEACRDSGRMPVFDQCEHCEGVGCAHCDQGLVPSTIPCPSCQSGRRG
jgi:hypothetical protein